MRLSKWIEQAPLPNGMLWMLISAAWFSAMALIVKYMSGDVNAYMMIFWRNVLSVLLFIPLFHKYGLSTLKTTQMPTYLLRAFLGVFGMTLAFIGFSSQTLPLATASALTYMVPIFSALLAIFILKERMGIHRWVAMFCGFIGMLIIIRPGLSAFDDDSLIIIIATLFWSVNHIIIKKLTKHDPPYRIVLMMVLLMIPFAIPMAYFNWQWVTWEQLCWLAILAFVANQAQLALTNAFQADDVSAVLPYDFSRLIFVAIGSYLLFGEMIDIWTAIGAIVILASSVYLVRREARYNREIAKALVVEKQCRM